LVQLTDLHVGDILGREWLEGIVERVNELKPDLIAITGDLADGTVARLSQTVACLARLEAAHGVYFVTGNHEYFSGVEQWLEHLPSLGIRVLRNERVGIGEGAVSFDLAGIDDHHGARRMAVHGPAGARRGAGHGPDLKRAVAGRDLRRELILLAHQPVAIFEASRLGVGLQLSGHTHGGQIWPMKYLVRLQQPYISGLVQHGPTQLYVSEGTGFWGPPMRLGTTSEITRITLRAA
jgi:predicted MPP superfamily phosphohydrolase